jgi:hypothetical protein
MVTKDASIEWQIDTYIYIYHDPPVNGWLLDFGKYKAFPRWNMMVELH